MTVTTVTLKTLRSGEGGLKSIQKTKKSEFAAK